MSVRSRLDGGLLPVVLGAASAAAATAVWLALTIETGLTYHVFPLVIVGAPVFVLALLKANISPVWLPALLLGVPAVAAGWVYLESTGNAPTATFVRGQPGGVLGEVVIFAALGVILAPRLMRFFEEPDE